ncbi:MAG: N-acetylneuraminic acid mutarotase/glucose/arabinose dehydrogenase [Chlamydiales bacterium]|jgi:N-acetylneuraminic acid mutarotase/glucose/arabinose dehydrogenase
MGGATAQTVEFSSALQTVAEADGSTLATVLLSQVEAVDVQATLVLSGTAAASADYTISPNPVIISAGNLSADVTITLTDDALFELDETAELTLTVAVNASLGIQVLHTVTIQSEDLQPGVEFVRLRSFTTEGDAPVDVPVVLSAPAGVDVQLSFVAVGQAQLGSDFTVNASPLVIPAGDTTANIVVTVIDDMERENPERVRLKLVSAVHANVTFPDVHNMVVDDNERFSPNVAVRPVHSDLTSIDFPVVLRAGEISGSTRVVLSNTNFVDVAVNRLHFEGEGPEFSYVIQGAPLPRLLVPGGRLSVDVSFNPQSAGQKAARLVVDQVPHAVRSRGISLTGEAFGATGEELLLVAGALDDFVDGNQDTWLVDYNFSGPNAVATTTSFQIEGTTDDALYHQSRIGADFSYAFNLPDGDYEVMLRFSEPQIVSSGLRVFDVFVEGVLEIADLDLAGAIGRWTAYDVPIVTTISDGVLDLQFQASTGLALISAIGIRSVPVVAVDPLLLDFVTVGQGQFLDLTVSLTNTGLHTAQLDSVAFLATVGSGADFSVEVGGQSYVGSEKSVTHLVNESIPVGGGKLDLDVTFAPTVHEDHVLTLRLEGNFPPVEVTLLGTGGADPSWGYLHPVLDAFPLLIVDYDSTGGESVNILGSESHTHEPGHVLTGYQWKLEGVQFSNLSDTRKNLPIGDNSISLTITDDNGPANTATDTRIYSVFPGDGVPGVLARYYQDADPVSLLDAVPAVVDFIERVPTVGVAPVTGFVGGSPYSGDVMVRLTAKFDVPSGATYEFTVNGGVGNRIEVDGAPVAGPIVLSAGQHDLELRAAVLTISDVPVSIDVLVDSVPAPNFDTDLVHSELGVTPVIHEMPTIGNDLGGNLISITGFGFYPLAQVTVHWGGQGFIDADFTSYSAELIEFPSPPGTGQINVTVETPAGISQTRVYTYSPTGPVPISFDRLTANQVPALGVTTGEWGPDGRFYVGLITGQIKAITYDENYVATNVDTYAGVSNLTNGNILGVAFNPWDSPSPVKIYVGHGEHFLNGGGSFSGPSPYTGQVSVLTGPNFNVPVAVLEKLPTSNHDHAINGLVFDNSGDLLVSIGGNTNAGVKAPLMGDLPESPLSAAIVRARISEPGFDGDLNYRDRVTLAIVNDQVFGEEVELVPGTLVDVHAPGLRNPYDICLTTWGYLYGTDNGPNSGFGPASTGATTQTSDPGTADELMLIESGNYYGHANRCRGVLDARQNIYRGTSASDIPGEFTQQISSVASSTDGLVEYRSTSFNDQMRGQLIIQKWNFRQRRVTLSADKRTVVEINEIYPQASALDVNVGPGGAIMTINYSGNKVEVMAPNDASIVGLKALDIFPWRAPAGGGHPFVIGGEHFGTLGNTSVTIGGIPATLTAVSTRRIMGLVPTSPTATDLVDVVVTVGGTPSTIPGAFKYLAASPGAGTGFWTSAPAMPDAVGEVSVGVVDGIMYVVGESTTKTYGYDIATSTWVSNLAQRPFTGNHHGSEVIDGKWYLIGGLSAGGGTVQIYDPGGDSWSTGAPMSWSGGSIATGVVDGKIYAVGGVVGSSTVGNAAVYDPVGDSWSALPAMPTGVNHAAASSDGEKFWVFGGRGGPNSPQPGFPVVQTFDPGAGTWDSSDFAMSDLVAMPSGRGGTGSAVFIRGEFYIFGGETNDAGDPEATPLRVFPDVFVYDPLDNGWRQSRDMITPRHGMYPVKFGGRIFVAGGGTNYGFSQSAVFEVLNF